MWDQEKDEAISPLCDIREVALGLMGTFLQPLFCLRRLSVLLAVRYSSGLREPIKKPEKQRRIVYAVSDL
ncbi:MAG: hypothetical protein NZ959_00630 [Armatimonadetes bacterium]|nr:hypothetical protein [Armatimonadota bacterium]MDW8121106.1 hypothetical protein [Armatimonadota bacterium]